MQNLHHLKVRLRFCSREISRSFRFQVKLTLRNCLRMQACEKECKIKSSMSKVCSQLRQNRTEQSVTSLREKFLSLLLLPAVKGPQSGVRTYCYCKTSREISVPSNSDSLLLIGPIRPGMNQLERTELFVIDSVPLKRAPEPVTKSRCHIGKKCQIRSTFSFVEKVKVRTSILYTIFQH